MRPLPYLFHCAVVFFHLSSVLATSSWSFDDATLSIQSKKAGVGGAQKDKLLPNKPLSKPIQLGSSDTLKILLTAKEDKKSKRPHQAFLLVEDLASGLDTSFPLAVKENGKGKVEITQKDIPSQFMATSTPLSASIIIGSFGASKPYYSHAFDLIVESDPNSSRGPPEKLQRYGKLPEIRHTFKPDPTSPPKIITIVFGTAVIAALPLLCLTWLYLNANLNHLSRALKSSPISHLLFFCSIIAMEAVFFMYYTSWNLFQTLPGAVATGLVIFLSGSRALREVQERRLSGLR
jgi:oligosaccharyltransferase complex subunit delta (ribophorin II)